MTEALFKYLKQNFQQFFTRCVVLDADADCNRSYLFRDSVYVVVKLTGRSCPSPLHQSLHGQFDVVLWLDSSPPVALLEGLVKLVRPAGMFVYLAAPHSLDPQADQLFMDSFANHVIFDDVSRENFFVGFVKCGERHIDRHIIVPPLPQTTRINC